MGLSRNVTTASESISGITVFIELNEFFSMGDIIGENEFLCLEGIFDENEFLGDCTNGFFILDTLFTLFGRVVLLPLRSSVESIESVESVDFASPSDSFA